jgi:hypothetical protein
MKRPVTARAGVLAAAAIAAALLACRSGGKSKCAATVSFDGKPGQGTGDGERGATDSACIDWCVQHDATVDGFYRSHVAGKPASGKSRFAEIYDAPGGAAVVEPCAERCRSMAQKGKELRVNCK